MAKITQRDINSYNTYLRYREQWHNKGYGLDRELTLYEYVDAKEGKVHGEHVKHPARDIAAAERTFSRSEARGYVNRLKDFDKYEDVDLFELEVLRHKYKTTKSIYSMEFTPEEAAENEATRKARIMERSKDGKEPQYTIQATARSRLFNQLRDAGLSYKEAERVLYG